MKIILKEIPIKEISEGYVDDVENGAFGYNGKLNIRPPFQREFVYNVNQRNEVIKTIVKGFPLNIMYWVVNNNGTYELLDGQQRTVSICQYINGDFSVDCMFFHNLTDVEKEQILNYKLMIYICQGNDKEKLDWFKIINIAGIKLTDQELRNATYTGEWLSDAKKYFSKNMCPAHDIASKYLVGSSIRQDYLETAIKWISERDGIGIEDYMSIHQHDTNANEMWLYFQGVINWVKAIFSNYRKEMKGLEWGIFYNKYKDFKYTPSIMEDRIKELMDDDEVGNKKGIYKFLLSGEKDQSSLNLRTFDEKITTKVYERQKGICPICDPSKHYEFEEMEADHIVPWVKGGKSVEDNCQMLCMHHNRTKSGK
ncbi:MAG: DUF262 domain-containing protein [Candidatus Paceibacterota bacterium]|jgi:hypothetical protein